MRRGMKARFSDTVGPTALVITIVCKSTVALARRCESESTDVSWFINAAPLISALGAVAILI